MKHQLALAACATLLLSLPAQAGGTGQFVLPPYAAIQNQIVEGEAWKALREMVAGDAKLLDGEEILSFDAPVQAFDAATVPFSISQRSNSGKRIAELTVVVDDNPMPIAAKFEFGTLMGDIHLESRVRYDVFSNIRAVAKTASGETYMVGRFVKAAGGCSTAVSRDLKVALSTMGQMKLKEFRDPNAVSTKAGGTVRDVQLMIRHPNFTGMQVKTGTLDYIDPRFLDKVVVKLGDDILFRMTGGFSISENPSFRFKFKDNGAGAITVYARDTEGAEFNHTFPLNSGV
ncbi:MAG: quinoprotein dehydrogenase-associated SoxYZ-like carrier [Rhizobiales bacterium]|nr:quinoprotein dehydrogenase-associated SoxYZ-like carrier [Hyphomicrobiales bacterium]